MTEALSSFFYPEYRLDWFDYGPGSPNRTAAFIGVWAVAVWWFALYSKRWGYWLSLILFSGCLVFLLQTESRGGLVAVVLGLLTLWTVARWRSPDRFRDWVARRSTWLRAAMLVAVGALGVWYSGELGMRERLVSMTSGDDESTNVRVQLYSAGLAMLTDAPGGVGVDQAGDFYAQWYQPIGDPRTYLSLVHSHLTWMAERGVWFKVGYVVAWAAIGVMLWPTSGASHLRMVSLAVWVTLFATGLFSRTLNLPQVWILPGILLLAVILERLLRRQWWKQRELVLGATGALASMILLLIASMLVAVPVRVAARDSVIAVGDGTAEPIWIVAPHRRVLGDQYGHSIREHLDDLGQVCLNHGTSWQTASPRRILFSGNAAFEGPLPESVEEIYLMNPSGASVEHWRSVAPDHALAIYLGGMGDWRRAMVWRQAADEQATWTLTSLPGVVDYIPDWPRYLLDPSDEPEVPDVASREPSTLASGFDPFASNP